VTALLSTGDQQHALCVRASRSVEHLAVIRTCRSGPRGNGSKIL